MGVFEAARRQCAIDGFDSFEVNSQYLGFETPGPFSIGMGERVDVCHAPAFVACDRRAFHKNY